MIKIIFTDVDGTLLDSFSKVSTDNIKACLNVQKANIPMVINTGRYGANARKVAEMIKVDHYHGYVIGNDGAEIWSFKEQKWIYLSQLTHSDCSKVFHWLCNYNTKILITFSGLNRMYVFKMQGRTKRWLAWLQASDFGILVKEIEKFNDINEKISKIIIVLEEPLVREDVNKFIKLFEVEFPHLTIAEYSGNFFSIGNKDVSKGSAINWLCQYLQIDVQDALAIGDGTNDLSMFKTAGHAVVMDNARENIKSYGEWIAPNNDNHGVYHTINHYIFNQQKKN